MKIDSFQGEYRFLSNFWLSPVQYQGHTFPSSENAYQFAKVLNPSDTILEIFKTCTPGDSKRMGRKATLRPDWDSIRIEVMREILKNKFSPGSELAFKLIQTGDAELIEGNTWRDTFWGVCNNQGENNLGKLLMEIRANLQEIDKKNEAIIKDLTTEFKFEL
jgi:ribA/ribD-fused uncharacterized protein